MLLSMDAGLDRLVKCTKTLQHSFWVTTCSWIQTSPSLTSHSSGYRKGSGNCHRQHSWQLLAVVLPCLVAKCSRYHAERFLYLQQMPLWKLTTFTSMRTSLHHILMFLSKYTAETITGCIVGSRIDYCNVLMLEAPRRTIAKLQLVRGNLARLVFNVSIRKLHDSGRNTFDLLCDLLWLAITRHLTFKIATLCYKGHHFGHPGSISDLLHH